MARPAACRSCGSTSSLHPHHSAGSYNALQSFPQFPAGTSCSKTAREPWWSATWAHTESRWCVELCCRLSAPAVQLCRCGHARASAAAAAAEACSIRIIHASPLVAQVDGHPPSPPLAFRFAYWSLAYPPIPCYLQADAHHHHHRSRLPPIHVRLCGGEADVTIRWGQCPFCSWRVVCLGCACACAAGRSKWPSEIGHQVRRRRALVELYSCDLSRFVPRNGCSAVARSALSHCCWACRSAARCPLPTRQLVCAGDLSDQGGRIKGWHARLPPGSPCAVIMLLPAGCPTRAVALGALKGCSTPAAWLTLCSPLASPRRLSDQGGGIAEPDTDAVWQFGFTTTTHGRRHDGGTCVLLLGASA